MTTTEDLYRIDPKFMWRDATDEYMRNKIETSELLIKLENQKLFVHRDMTFIKDHLDAIKFWNNLLKKEF